MNETTHRFLQAIVDRLPSGRIAELRLFPAIRQGGIESAVAVVALEQPELPLAVAPPVDGSDDGFAEHQSDDEPVDGEIVVTEVVTEVVSEVVIEVVIEVVTDAVTADVVAADGAVAELPPADEPIAEALDVEVTRIMTDPFSVHAEGIFPLGTGAEGAGEQEAELQPADEDRVPAATPAAMPAATPAAPPDVGDTIKRYAILTAHYRLTLKGPDRGKWEVDIVHEADAPLATLERVARGVARRAGDESDPEHFSGDALRHAIGQPSWVTSA